MNSTLTQQLRELAELNGVQTAYRDMNNVRQTASPEIVAAALGLLEVPANTTKEIRDSLRRSRSQPWSGGVDPVTVAWDQERAKIRLLATGSVSKSLHVRLHLEDGRLREFSSAGLKQQSTRPTSNASIHELTLPPLPFGCHRAEVEWGSRVNEVLVLSAPQTSYSEGGHRDWGLFLPMYAAHSRKSWGAGNLSDWRTLCDFTASFGGHLVATLPLLAAFLDFPTCDPSPYSPASRLFWNEFYLDITAVPEFARCAEAKELVRSSSFQNRLHSFRQSRYVDYEKEWALRRMILEKLANSFFRRASTRRAEFDRFLSARPEAIDYARFRAVCDKRNRAWQTWPQRLREGRIQKGDYNEANERFHLYIQWLAQEQMDDLIAHSERGGVKLYLDLPLGVHSDGYDIWRHGEHFVLNASAGAPPDVFFTKGQDWGFAPLHPRRIREQGYRYVLDFLRFQMRHTGLLRLDHIMGLHRLYWIPRGFSAAQGVYVSYPAEELHAIFNIESHRHRTILVGENLGTVPPEVNQSMKAHALREMFVLQYEQRPDPRAALRSPPACSAASINTHDMPAFAAHWQGLDLEDRADLGLIPPQNLEHEELKREKLNQALTKFLAQKGFLKKKKPAARDVLEACLAWLGQSPAEFVLVTLEDLLLEEQPQNVPGTFRERPNWLRKAKWTLEKIFRQSEVRTILKRLGSARKQ